MSASIFIPPPLKFTKKCDRCGLLYPEEEDICTHCNGLTDEEVETLKEKYAAELKGNSNLGLLLLFFSVFLIGAMLLFK